MIAEATNQDALTGPTRYSVNIPAFEGPLDLLLFLVKKHEVDIYDIPIHEVTCQYLNVLRDMRRLNLEVAGEFFVMAATLMYIKSRMLLPPDEALGQEEEEEEGSDPRWNLIQQLLEYQRFKEAAAGIQEMIIVNQDYLPRLCPSPATGQQSRLKPSDQIEIWNTFNAVLRRIAEELIGEGVIHDENVTIAGSMETIIERLKNEREFLFSTLFSKGDSMVHLVASFLAILELSRLKQLIIEQHSHFTDILILAGKSLDADNPISELDTDEVDAS